MQRTRGFMPENVFDRLLANIEKYQIAGVRVIGWGEPTLHPKWFSMLENIKKVRGGGDTAPFRNEWLSFNRGSNGKTRCFGT